MAPPPPRCAPPGLALALRRVGPTPLVDREEGDEQGNVRVPACIRRFAVRMCISESAHAGSSLPACRAPRCYLGSFSARAGRRQAMRWAALYYDFRPFEQNPSRGAGHFDTSDIRREGENRHRGGRTRCSVEGANPRAAAGARLSARESSPRTPRRLAPRRPRRRRRRATSPTPASSPRPRPRRESGA